MSDKDTPKQETETPQSKANAVTEKLFADYNADSGKDSPEGQVNAALTKGAKAVEAMQATIVSIDGHAEFVDIDKLTKIDINKLRKGKDKKDIKDKLLRANYTGDSTEIHIWRGQEYRAIQYPKDTTKKTSGKKFIFNIASASCKIVSDAILDAASSAKFKMEDLVDEAFAKIPEDEYANIHKSGGAEKVKEKVKIIASKLSGNNANGHENLDQKNKKLQNDDGKYIVVDAPVEK
jgi:hypothetical protein